MPRGRRKTFFKILLLLVSLAASLAAAEWMLRKLTFRPTMPAGTDATPKAAFYGWAMPPWEVYEDRDPDSGEPLVFAINSQGWRDVEHSFEKPENAYRIVVLGDSFTFGFVPFEHLYTRRVEALLRERGHDRVEVITMGVPGWGTDQELEALKREGILYQPDAVILQFTENDLVNNLLPRPSQGIREITSDLYWKKTFRYELVEGELRRLELEPEPGLAATPLGARKSTRPRSALLFHLGRLLDAVKSRISPPSPQKAPIPERGLPPEGEGEQPYWKKPWNPTTKGFLYRADLEIPSWPIAWNLLEALLAAMRDCCLEQGAQLAVFTDVGDRGYREFCLESGLIDTDEQGDFILWEGERYEVDMDRPLEDLEAICDRLEIALIAPRREYSRYRNDPHTDAEGNEKMAEDIVEFLLNWEPFLSKAK